MKLLSKAAPQNTQNKKSKKRNRLKPTVYHAASPADIVLSLKPALPLYMIWPEKLASKARAFTDNFPGTVMYAVKCNPAPDVIRALYKNGIQAFDVASVEEIKIARKAAPSAKLYFMHPVKSSEAIRTAYFKYNVRTFVLDTMEELYKIVRETDLAPDLELFVRMAMPKNESAQIDFASKFGATSETAVELLKEARAVASNLGLCFHVGTQTMDPLAYSAAIQKAAEVIRKSDVTIDALDIGGGFPVAYPDQAPPDFTVYVDEIKRAVKLAGIGHIPLLCEPGRALVAEAGSLIVRVEQRRGDILYINDGTYGGLFDAGQQLKTRYPVHKISEDDIKSSLPNHAFQFAGPTCDSLDMMPGPFVLPPDIKTGDWIQIDNMGAYSYSLRSNFNGFGTCNTVHIVEENLFEIK